MSLLVGSEFVVQFKDVARTTNPGSDRVNFQIRLNTSTNEIKIVYGTCVTGATSTTATNFGQVGLRGSANTIANNLLVTGTAPYDTWANAGGASDNGATPILATGDGIAGPNVMRYTNACLPASGQSYLWTPITSSFYQGLPYTQNFDSWTSASAVNDVPATTGILNSPSTGNASWRNVSESTINSLWNSTSGQFTGATQAGTGSATFNQYNAPNAKTGNLDFYLNFSPTGSKEAKFYIKNPGTANANDILNVYLSTDGGVSFLLVGTYAAPITAWTQQTVTLGSSTNTNCILRFQGVSDYGTALENLGIDELSVSILTACTTPTAQPTALNLTSVTATTLSGSFTAASPAPSKYLVVRSTSATAPVPVNGTTYAVASTALGAGTYVVSNTNATTFSETSLTSNTKYYYYIFSYNDACTGAPFYLTATAPLSNSTTTCLSAPTSTAGSVVTSAGFTANWTALTGATGYLLDVATTTTFNAGTFVAGYNSLAVTGTSQVVTGLSSATTYYYRVRATNATACTSANSGNQTVLTLCSNESVPTVLQSFTTASMPVCWSTGLVTGSTNWAPSTSNDAVNNAYGGTGYFMGKAYNSSDALVYSQPINLSSAGASATRINVWIWRDASNIAGDRIRFHINTSQSITGATQLLEIFPRITTAPIVATEGWYNYTADIPTSFNVNSTVYIIGQGTTAGGSSSYGLGFDDFKVELVPSCIPPTLLTTSAVTDVTATFSWTAPAAAPASYDIYYGTGSVATPLAVPVAGTTATTTSTTNSKAITSLSSNTSYQYYVRSACGGSNGNSAWAGPYTFVTACGAINVPYTQNFDGVTQPAMPSCFSVENTNGDTKFWKTCTNTSLGNSTAIAPNSGANQMGIAYDSANAMNDWFYLPGINLTSGTSYRLSFYTRGYTALTEQIEVKYGTSATSGSMTNTILASTAVNGGIAYTQKVIDFVPSSTGIYYIGFHGFSAVNQWYLFVDDVSVTLTPIDAVDFANIQSPGVSTTTTGTPTTILGQAYEPGLTPTAGAPAGLSVWYSTNATDVDPSSTGWTGTWTLATYNAQVANNDEWKATIYPISGQADTYYSFRYQLNGGPYKYGGYSISGGGFWDGTTNKNGKLSVNYEVYTNSAPKTINDVIDIYFKDFDVNNMFYSGSETTVYMYGGVQVAGVGSQYVQGNLATLSTLLPFSYQSPGLYKATVRLSDYFCIPTGTIVEGVNILFRNQLYSGGGCDGSVGNNDKTCDLFLDLTDAAVQLNAPTVNVATAITSTTATINWTAPVTGSIKGYDYYYSTSSTAPTSGTTPSGSTLVGVVTANLTALTPSTLYNVWVRTKGCGTNVSAWSTVRTFTTLAVPPANDACSAAANLPCATVAMAGTTVATVSETLSVTGWSTSNYGVWYTFVGDGTRNIISSTAGSGFDHEISIASGTCGSLTNVGAVDDAGAGGTETYIFTPTLGTTYYVYIAYYGTSGNASNTGTFTISRTCNAPITYCTPTTENESNTFINDVKFVSTLNDVSNLNSSFNANGYQDWTALPKAIQAQGEGMNVYVDGNYAGRIKAWVDWNKDGDFDDSGEEVYDSTYGTLNTTFGFVIPAATSIGDYRLRIRLGAYLDYFDEEYYYDNDFSACENFIDDFNYDYVGEAEDYLFTVIANCSADITAVSNVERCGPGAVTLTATGSAAVTQYKWYTALTGGSPVYTSASNTYSPTVSATTSYFVAGSNGTCESLVRKEIVARVKELPAITLPATLEACGDNTPVVLSATANSEIVYLVEENFEAAAGLGLFENQNIVSNGGTLNPITRWQKETSPHVPATGEDVWVPAISSGFGVNKFAMATSDIGMQTSTTYYTIDHGISLVTAVNTTSFTNLTLKFKMYFSRFLNDNSSANTEYAAVEVSTDGGTNWVTTPAKYIADVGLPSKFQNMTVDLSSYINQSNLKFRIRYYSKTWGDGVAVDDIQLYGTKTLVPSFTWSGAGLNVFTDAGMTIPYTAGTPASTVYAVPDISTLGNSSFDINVSTTVTNGCTVTKTINVTNKSKVWTGSASADWNNPNNWSPSGVPNNTACIIIPNTTVKPIVSGAASGKNISIKPLGELLVNSNNTLTINDAVEVKSTGKLTFENNASLVQVNESPSINSGNIIYKRNSGNMLRYSYTYWASPVFATAQTLSALSPATLHDKYYSWNSTSQSWTLHDNGSVAMEKAKGYIVRAPQTFPITGTAASYNASFNGVPNNGLITIATQGSTTAEKFNLIGNPYPSALDANLFLANSINPGLEGTIYLWTNFTGVSSVPNSSGFYQYTNSDYATYNFSGGTATAPATGSLVQPTGYVAAGQSFFVKGISNGSGTATFNNTMRVGANNNQFFRNSQIERHRLWLNLENSQGGFNQALVAYVQGATNDYDRGYDGELFGGNTATFYSIISDKLLTIQGKSLPFDLNDRVPMGFKTTVAGNYKITLDHFDGLFDAQEVYLKDKMLNTIHDIKTSPYSFTSAIGTFDDRFEIVYKRESLGVDNPQFNANSVVIYKKDKEIFINTGLVSISQLKVFDIQGRMIYENKNINKSDAVIKNLPPAEQVLIVQVFLVDGNIVSKKVVY